MSVLRFAKMHGAGNDFVVLDAIDHPVELNAAQIRLLADRRRGIGFDQLLLLRRADPADSARAAFAYDIYNTDGSTAQQCGNGARCVAAWLAQERAADFDLPNVLLSPSGLVEVQRLPGGALAVSLPPPGSAAVDGLLRQFDGAPCRFDPVDLGNPHLVVAVPEVAAAAVQVIGAALNADAALPDGANVEFVERCADGSLKVRVYERGVGETLACGSGACAVAVVAIRRGWASDRSAVQIHMPGGQLCVSWPHDAAALRLSGPTCRVFDGVLHPDFFQSQQVALA